MLNIMNCLEGRAIERNRHQACIEYCKQLLALFIEITRRLLYFLAPILTLCFPSKQCMDAFVVFNCMGTG